MIVNLIKPQQMYSLTLPNKIKGQYWIMDTDDSDRVRELLSVEAADGEWIVKSNKYVTLLDGDNRRVESLSLRPQSFINLKLADRGDRVILFAESVDPSRQTFYKIAVRQTATFTVGRTADNHLCYENRLVSGNHAKLSYDGHGWFVTDTGSTNGTYVNGYRVTSQALYAGDFLYIMGLKIIIGQDYLAVNNPDGLLSIRSEALGEYHPQVADSNARDAEETEKRFFYRSPRFFREISHAEFTIDPPPQLPKQDTVPLALMLGPSITMGLTSLSTGILSLTNVLAQGGEVTQALPSLLMSVSMLLGTILWPILTKRHETKVRIRNERKRQEKYLDYLEQIRDDIKRKGKEQSDILNENRVSPSECAARITGETTNLWERSIGHNDFLHLRLGLGKLPLDATVNCQEKRFTMEDDALQDAMLSLWAEPKQLTNVPITVSMVENNTVGIYGDDASANHLLKSLMLQMVALHGYDELKIMLVTDGDREEEWHFARCMPHLWNDDKSVRFFATSADEVKELSAYIDQNILTRGDDVRPSFTELSPYYVLLFVGKSLSEKCEALQKLLDYKNNRGFSVLFVTPELKDLPKETKLVISAEGRESRMFDRDDTAEKGVCFQMDTFDEEAMEELAQKIANIELDMGSQRYALPDMVTFLEMFRVGKIEHLNSLTRWKENNPTITLQTPIGVDAYGGLFHLDLHEKYHGPHGLVAGMTGSGKSEFIITFILSLAVNYHPDEVAFILIDYKGGGLTGAFEDPDRGIKLPHLAGCITNLDGAAVKRSLISIQSELRRRQAIFNEARRVSNEGTMDIYKYQKLYRDKVVTEPVPHLFIISDEFAELKTQQPEFMEQLISAARIGRSLGVHLILATQKPSGVVDDQIWSNSKFRVCLKVQEKADSQDMIKCPDAAELSQTGRFYLQVGFNELFALGQSAWCGAEYVPSETVEKPVDESVQVVDNLGRVMLSVKPEKKRALTESRIKQIVAIVKYLSNLAAEESITVRPLWLDPIPANIYVDALEQKYGVRSKGLTLTPVVGEYDDPFNQKQGVLTVPFSAEGNCLIYGATGNGKTTFLTTLAYSLLKNHTAEELNLYIMDYGSETLKVFEKAPQVGGVMLSADEEKTVNFLKMLHREMEKRRNLFSEFGGDYAGYCRNSGKSVPNIVVLINNYSGFAEQFEDWQEELTLLTRDGVKYGIYFAVTAGSTNAVRYKMQQNFRTMLTMQLNDVTDYTVVVGKTDGLIPSKFKGRGLVALERVYEFQTAYCTDEEDVQDYLRAFCKGLAAEADSFATPVPVLPRVVDLEHVRSRIRDFGGVPVGVNKASLEIAGVNLQNKVVLPVAAQELTDTVSFTQELTRVLRLSGTTVVVDAEKLLTETEDTLQEGFETFVQELFAQMVERNNTYKDAKLDTSVLEPYEERVYVIHGLKRFCEQLSADGKDKFGLLIEKAEAIYKLHFVLVDALTPFNSFSYETWYKRQITGGDGLWIGDGVADQYMLKVNKVTSDLYEEIGPDYGYLLTRNRPALLKLLSSERQEEV